VTVTLGEKIKGPHYPSFLLLFLLYKQQRNQFNRLQYHKQHLPQDILFETNQNHQNVWLRFFHLLLLLVLLRTRQLQLRMSSSQHDES
jgi:hypothetical protein